MYTLTLDINQIMESQDNELIGILLRLKELAYEGRVKILTAADLVNTEVARALAAQDIHLQEVLRENHSN